MNKYNATQAEQIKQVATYLKEQRVKQELSLEQIASMTFIRLPMLQALESDDIEQLPELVYVQGFIRRYGDALNLDGNSLSHQIAASESENTTLSPDLVAPPLIDDNMGQEVPATVAYQNNHKSVAVKSKPRAFISLSEESREPSKTSWVNRLRSYWIYLVVVGGAIAGSVYFLSRPPATEQTGQTRPTQTRNISTQTRKTSQLKTIISSEEPSPILESP